MSKHNAAVVEMTEMPTGGASDITLKMDVQPIRSSLKQLLSLHPVSWHRREREYGFEAEEVERALRQFVSHAIDDDGARHAFLSSKEMIPILVTAIQEQQKQIEALTKKLKKLQK